MRRVLVGVVVLPVLLLAACQGNEDSGQADVDDIPTTVRPTTSSTSSTSTTAPGNEQTPPPSIPGPVEDRGQGDATRGTVDVQAENFAFDPTYIRAVEGARIVVNLRNDTSTRHTFTMAGSGVDEELASQASTQVTVTLPRGTRGPIVFVCRFHEAQGMKGAFYVQ